MSKYIRTEVISFYELPEQAQKVALSENDEAENESFVESPIHPGEFLSLGNFLRSNSKIWDGFFGTSYFSGYFIKLSPCGSQAVVGYRHW